MGTKGFQKGHIVSEETRAKISKAKDGNFYATCDYCGKEYHTKKSQYKKRKRHFCCRKCYSSYRKEIMPPEEQNAYGHGYSLEERRKRAKARTILNHYLRDKHLERQPCEICGEKAEAHHDDYDNPLDVRWLCFNHHRQLHQRQSRAFGGRKMNIDLEPCPFCKGKNLSIYVKGINDKKYAVCCNTCDARGGRKQNKGRAVEEWNRRANNDN